MLKHLLEKLPISRKFSIDAVWNLICFAIVGSFGILVNIIIAKYYGADVLGVFNQVFAIFVLLSQISVAGVHLAVLKYVSQFAEDRNKTDNILSAALYITFVISLLVPLGTFFLKDFAADMMESPRISTGILFGLPGLFFWALNKVYLAFHNACQRIISYSVLNALRFIFLVIYLVLFIVLDLPGERLPVIISFSEVTLFIICVVYSMRYMTFSYNPEVKRWIKELSLFGFKAAPGHILLDINTRVDVIMLGIFCSDQMVGVYSFAAMLADGYNNFPVVFRTNVNPMITQYRYSRKGDEFRLWIRKGVRLGYTLFIPMGIVVIFLFPLLMNIFRLGAGIGEGWAVFAILISGISLSAGYIPFQMILSQTGFPSYQSVYIFFVFTTNVVLNFILIPIWGMMGAALATALSAVVQVVYLKLLVAQKLNIKI